MTEPITSIEYGEPISFEIDSDGDLVRLDKTLSKVLCEYSRSFVQGLFADGLVMCGGRPVQKNYKPRQGDTVSFTVPEPKLLSVGAQDIPLNIMYEDSDLLVVNKPQGMVVHPAPGNYDGTLVNALLWHCKGNLSGINGVIRPGIVHRIDKDTSGLLLVAKTDAAHASLAAQIKEHSLDREYRAVICGKLRDKSGVVDAPIGRSPADRKKMCVTDKNSKNAVTHYEVLEEFGGYSFVRLRLETGRTHQIRVHMAYLGHPVAGDPLYGSKDRFGILSGQCLHAGLIGFTHPTTEERVRIEAPLPEYFTNFLRRIKQL